VPRRLTYSESGVDIDEKGIFVSRLVSQLKKSEGALSIGHFAGGMRLKGQVFTLACDGVGSKIMIARAMNKWDTVGIDCVAMNVNDTVCIGARPLALVDYIALPRVELDLASPIGRGLNRGADAAGATIVGGEVAVLPDMLKEVDISATCMGIADRRHLITGRAIRPGDVIIGMESSGVHSNGFTLIRRILSENNIALSERFGRITLGQELLKPTEIYVKSVLRLLKKVSVHGIAHITGGGFRNILRLKESVRFHIEELPPIPPIFEFISREGNVEQREMFQTFNMGIGMVIVISEKSAEPALSLLGRSAHIIGHVEEGRGVFIREYGLSYMKY
jgi:phosphoribosylformylglycinamidine cyclo-ligase